MVCAAWTERPELPAPRAALGKPWSCPFSLCPARPPNRAELRLPSAPPCLPQLINETDILDAFEASDPDLLMMTGDIVSVCFSLPMRATR